MRLPAKKSLGLFALLTLSWACTTSTATQPSAGPPLTNSPASTEGLGATCAAACSASAAVKCASPHGDCPSGLCLVDTDRYADGHLTYCTVDCTSADCPSSWHCEDIKSFGNANVKRACVADDESSFTPDDAGMGGDAGANCNLVVQRGKRAPVTGKIYGTMPTGQGGTIADGTYVRTRQTYYGDPGGGTFDAETMVVEGSVVNFVRTEEDATEWRATYTLARSGNRLTLTRTCLGDPDEGTTRYASHEVYDGLTATPSELRLYIAQKQGVNLETIFTKK